MPVITMLLFILFQAVPLMAQLRVPYIPKENSNLHDIIYNGKTISEPENCIEKEIRRRTVFIDYPGSVCTGVILDEKTILTAGHCEKGEKNRKIKSKIFDGSSITYFNEKKNKFEKMSGALYASAQFEGVEKGNLGLKDAAAISVSKISGKYPRLKIVDPKTLKGGEPLIVAGFGEDETNNVGKLKYLKGSYITTTAKDGSEVALVLSDENSDKTYKGDSGGPTFRANGCSLELAGITVMGAETVEGGKVSIFKRKPDLEVHINELNSYLNSDSKNKSHKKSKGRL